MAITSKIYKGPILMGTGTGAAGTATITSYTQHDSGGLTNDVSRKLKTNRNVRIVCTGGASSNGTYYARVTIDGPNLAAPTTTITLDKTCPYT